MFRWGSLYIYCIYWPVTVWCLDVEASMCSGDLWCWSWHQDTSRTITNWRIVTSYDQVSTYILSQEHVSGRSAWQNMWVRFSGMIARDRRSSSILLPNPTSIFWQADLPQTCSWFYLMLPCYLRHTMCGNNIIKYRNVMWWSTPTLFTVCWWILTVTYLW